MNDERPRTDLVEPEGVNAGSAAAERDRRPDGDVVAGREVAGPELRPEPPEELVGVDDQRPGTPGQELAAGEG